MAYTITYNNFGSGGATNFQWDHIRLQEYTSQPLFADDDQTHWSTRHTISGTALLTVESGAMSTVIENARAKLSKAARNLLIQVDGNTIASVGNNDFDTTDGLASPYSTSGIESTFAGGSESTGFPRCTFEINEFYGTANAMVTFSFEWIESKMDSLESAETSFSVMAHHWRQSFTIDESGLQRWVVNGSLHVKPYAPAGDGAVNRGRNPDSYRGLVMPSIPSNFRVKKMDWATEQSGEKLLYTLEFQEHARRLPAPAKKGMGTFTFRKSIDSDAGLLGVKMFDAELEGDANAKTTELLASLLDASTKRIKWTGLGKDLITSIEVRETEIFSKKRIGLRVTAKGLDVNVVKVLQGQAIEGTGLNFGILTDFVSDDNIATAPSVYGSALITSYKRQFFVPYAGYDVTNFPIAQLMTTENSDTTGTTGGANPQAAFIEQVYEVEDGGLDGSEAEHDDLTGDLISGSSTDDLKYHYLKVRGTERLGVKYNITAFPTYDQSPTQIPWQTAPPDIFLESEYVLTRHDEPPPMLQFQVPIYAVVIDEQTSVDAGEIDGNGHRIFTRHLKRKLKFMWGWSDDQPIERSQFGTWTIGDSQVTILYRYPEIKDLMRPYDPRLDSSFNIINNSIFTGNHHDEIYPISFSVPIGTFG